MPEYLSPGVYVEETSFRSKSIEGVSTSTAGFVGPARWGPVSGQPELLTSLADFELYYGGSDDLVFDGVATTNYLWHGVRAFFEEGGQRLYVSRIFNFGSNQPDTYYAFASPSDQVTIRARFPGAASSIRVSFTLRVGPNILSWSGPTGLRTPILTRVQEFTLLYVRRKTNASEVSNAIQARSNFFPTDPAKTAANQFAQVTKAEAAKNGATFQSIKDATKTAADAMKSAADAIDGAVNRSSATDPKTLAADAQKYVDDNFKTEPAKTAANLVAQAAKEAADKGEDIVQKVKDAANAIKVTIDTIVNTALVTTPQAVADAAQIEANQSTTGSPQTVANLVAQATKAEAVKNGATVQSVKDVVKKVNDTINAAIDAVVIAAQQPSATEPQAVVQATQAKANSFATEPAKTAANLVAQAVQEAAVQEGATVQSIQAATTKAAQDMKSAVGAVVSAANVVLTPWLPFSKNPAADNQTLEGLYISHLVPDPTGPFWTLNDSRLDDLNLPDDASVEIRPITVLVEISRPLVDAQGLTKYDAPESSGEYNFDPHSVTGLTRTFTLAPATRFEALHTPFAIDTSRSDLTNDQGILDFIQGLMGSTVFGALNGASFPIDALRVTYTLTSEKSDDGALPNSTSYEGHPDFKDISNDQLQMPQNGLLAFESVEDISIVAAPGYSVPYATQGDRDQVFAIHQALITHCEKMRYRVAVLDTPKDQLVSGALDFRNLTSSKYAALYYPWITILDPVTNQRLNLPPSGFVAGIYARNDTEHGVSKAPANEVVRLAIDFEQRLNKAQQDVLNPEGVNCFRFFPGRGFLLWGARTIIDDSEWKYISVRRYFAYLEHSIDRGTQWVVFENNNKQLWDNVRRTVEDFLLNEWKMGALMGDKPEQAYFVRCDLSTMTQNDLDNGRLICLIGVAVVKPAEFVIFRIGQKTATTN